MYIELRLFQRWPAPANAVLARSTSPPSHHLMAVIPSLLLQPSMLPEAVSSMVDVGQALRQCWSSVSDAGPALPQRLPMPHVCCGPWLIVIIWPARPAELVFCVAGGARKQQVQNTGDHWRRRLVLPAQCLPLGNTAYYHAGASCHPSYNPSHYKKRNLLSEKISQSG